MLNVYRFKWENPHVKFLFVVVFIFYLINVWDFFQEQRTKLVSGGEWKQELLMTRNKTEVPKQKRSYSIFNWLYHTSENTD